MSTYVKFNNTLLTELRTTLNSKNISEWATLHNAPDLFEVLSKINELQNKIGEEKLKVLNDIDQKYAEELERLEKEYALILKLSAV